MADHRLHHTNYNIDDDTCEVHCSCGWWEDGFESEEAALTAIDEHILEARDEDGAWF
jgi:hypothetical protein